MKRRDLTIASPISRKFLKKLVIILSFWMTVSTLYHRLVLWLRYIADCQDLDWNTPSFGRAEAYGWATSTPVAEKQPKLEISVKIHDGMGLRDMKINSEMTLRDLINEAVSVTRGRSTFEKLGYTAC